MAEHRIKGRVIGVSMDGTGYGTDGHSWGSEFMVAGCDSYTRIAHFEYIPLPGGDKAIEEPWRMAYAYLYRYFGDEINYFSIPAFKNVSSDQLLLLRHMINRNINVPLSSGAGRLFDAVSAITGLCSVSGFDAEAPVRLESVITDETEEQYGYDTTGNIVFAETFRGILADLGKRDISLISAKFHNTIASAIADVTADISRKTGLRRVVLSGGLFQNKYLTERSIKLLKAKDLEVLVNRQVPSNDGGISLGQLIIASKSDKYVFKHTC
jgi:hydrogenase maturation protein HypF